MTQVPGTVLVRSDRNSPLGSGSPTMPTSDRSKQPTSSVGPYRFFTHQAQPRVPFALELQDHVDQVLEHARAGDRPVLGHVPDQEGADAA